MEKYEKAKEFINASDMERAFQMLMDQMDLSYDGAVKSKILDYIAELYSELFSENELDELIAVYSLSIMKRARDYGPEIMQRIANRTVQIMEEMKELEDGD